MYVILGQHSLAYKYYGLFACKVNHNAAPVHCAGQLPISPCTCDCATSHGLCIHAPDGRESHEVDALLKYGIYLNFMWQLVLQMDCGHVCT